MPRPLKWSILGAHSIILSKNIHKVTKTDYVWFEFLWIRSYIKWNFVNQLCWLYFLVVCIFNWHLWNLITWLSWGLTHYVYQMFYSIFQQQFKLHCSRVQVTELRLKNIFVSIFMHFFPSIIIQNRINHNIFNFSGFYLHKILLITIHDNKLHSLDHFVKSHEFVVFYSIFLANRTTVCAPS